MRDRAKLMKVRDRPKGSTLLKTGSERKNRSGSHVLWLVLLFYPDVSYAYIDPGTGSIVAQATIAAVLGVVFWIKLAWRRIVQFVSRMFSGKGREESDIQR